MADIDQLAHTGEYADINKYAHEFLPDGVKFNRNDEHHRELHQEYQERNKMHWQPEEQKRLRDLKHKQLEDEFLHEFNELAGLWSKELCKQ